MGSGGIWRCGAGLGVTLLASVKSRPFADALRVVLCRRSLVPVTHSCLLCFLGGWGMLVCFRILTELGLDVGYCTFASVVQSLMVERRNSKGSKH